MLSDLPADVWEREDAQPVKRLDGEGLCSLYPELGMYQCGPLGAPLYAAALGFRELRASHLTAWKWKHICRR